METVALVGGEALADVDSADVDSAGTVVLAGAEVLVGVSS